MWTTRSVPPGSSDRRVVVGGARVQGREAILRVHTKRVPLGDDADLYCSHAAHPELAGADFANLVNEAAQRFGSNPTS